MAKKAKAPAKAERALPGRVVIHVSRTLTALDRKAVARDLAKAAPALGALEWRDDLASAPMSRALHAKLAGARVTDLKVPDAFHTAVTADLDAEAAIDGKPQLVTSAELAARLYDGHKVSQAALPCLPEGERSTATLHVWVTRRMLGTYSADEMRYHARYAVFGYPVVFSLLGLGLSPAPSVEATLFARELARRGANAAQIEMEVDREYPEERVDIDDAPTVAAAVASTVLQGAAAAVGKGPFCRDPACRLFNAHRKAEMRASFLGGKLCRSHARLFAAGGRSR